MNAVNYLTKEYNKNETVFSEVKFASQLGIIITGEITVIKNHYSGKLIKLNTLKPGYLLGISAIFNDKMNYPSELIAQKLSKIIFIKQDELMKIFAINSKVLENYLGYVSNRINFLNNKIEVFTYNNIEDRVLHFLRLRCTEINSPVEIKMTKTDLANYLAISRSSLYRALDKLQQSNCIQLINGNIYLADKAMTSKGITN